MAHSCKIIRPILDQLFFHSVVENVEEIQENQHGTIQRKTVLDHVLQLTLVM